MGAEKKLVCDVAILGSSQQAALIAGLLAREHNRKVCLVVDPSIQHRLSREIGLGVDCITRPQTWEMLNRLRVEATRMLTGIGGARAVRQTNPLFLCTTDAGADALAHMYHVAQGSGYEVEKITLPRLPRVRTALRMRGIKTIERGYLRPMLERWLLAGGVRLVKCADPELSFRRDQSGTALAGALEVTFKKLVFADEQALWAFARPLSLEAHFKTTRMTTLISEPEARLQEQMVINPEHGFCARRGGGNIFEILARGTPDNLGEMVDMNLPGGHLLRRAGQSTFRTMRTRDGAPMVGRLGRGGGWAVAGFGHFGAFMAPAIARYLAGRPQGFEETYFKARGACSSRKSRIICEFNTLQSEAQ